MTKKREVDAVTEIGNFKRPEASEKGAGILDAPTGAIGQDAIRSFISGGTMADIEKGGDTATKAGAASADSPKKTDKTREAELLAAIDEVEQSPELTYDQKLEKHKLSKTQALEILDSMFSKGFFEKTYKVTGSVSVTFRTRKTEDQDRLLQRLEAENPQFPVTVSNLVSKYNLAASLWEYKGKAFEGVVFKERYNYVSMLPDIILRILCMKLSRFDQLVIDVLDEGAIENF